MKYALIGDIHSNILDLNAVLQQINDLPYDVSVVGMGDLFECLIGKKAVKALTKPLPISTVQQNPDGFECLLTFPSIRGNQEERIMRATQTSQFIKLPETIQIEGATLIHGHQFKWSKKWIPNYEPFLDEALLFFGHSHDSALYHKQKQVEFTFGQPIFLTKKKYGINVGSVVDHREWVLYDTDEKCITFMKAE